ncbi:MAG: 23S rRNA (cytosine(1962)-C(5))-methyltransferase RlmI, partial [Caldilineaceae bacterium]|nr:23S rRNA (cytosine(1962)-C(5))-methyltransferase RlmI [Caldilineaceae bacterium]
MSPPSSGAPPEVVRLRQGRERPVLFGHPWIYRGAIDHIPATLADGDIVDVHGADGGWLARGYLN